MGIAPFIIALGDAPEVELTAYELLERELSQVSALRLGRKRGQDT